MKLINIPGHTEEENKFIQEKHKELLKDARENNNSDEVVYISGQNYFAKEYGSKKEVSISSGSDASLLLLQSPDKSLTLMDHHPDSSIFSVNDIFMFVNYESLKTMTIVTNLGQVKYINETSNYNLKEVSSICSRVFKNIDESDITTKFIEGVLKKSYNSGNINYKVR